MSESTSKRGGGGGKLSLGGSSDKFQQKQKRTGGGQVRQSFSHGRSKSVDVEVKRTRRSDGSDLKGGKPVQNNKLVAENPLDGLSDAERQARLKVLEQAQQDEARRRKEAEDVERRAEEAKRRREEEEAQRKAAEAASQAAASDEKDAPESGSDDAVASVSDKATPSAKPKPAEKKQEAKEKTGPTVEELADASAVAAAAAAAAEAGAGGAGVARDAIRGRGREETIEDKDAKKPPRAPMRTKGEPRRRQGKLTISQALEDDGADQRQQSMAALKRRREREKQQNRDRLSRGEKVVREVTIPEAITVGDLANRMAERTADVIKVLMKSGIMAGATQAIDADTAELLVEEFGHKVKRVSEADVEDVLVKPAELEGESKARAPVVTVMGHVDHGKTSLLDALRATDVAAGEAGGITQHIGAYQVELSSGAAITFLDTPGHAAFTAMRQRGAQVTDIVVLVVAADDGISPQTVEAINHAKAAEVPIIVAINKIDKEGADPTRARNQLLEHELVPEEMGGDVQVIEVSALKRLNLDALEEAILLQAEVMELKAVEDGPARGAVVEAKLEKGRGSVATALIQSGTLNVGDIFVAGQEWGRVRALLDDRGQQVKSAGPSEPVEILGLQGTPQAGDELIVLEDESRAREIAEYRQRKAREANFTISGRGTLEQMFERVKAGEAEQLPVVVKSDVQGSLEAISAALDKLATDEVKVRVLHGAVGGITESDITLASSTGGVVIGFNVRANPQAREHAKRDGVDIRYYSVIYDLIDDVKAVLSGMLAPEEREKFLGYAQIRDVFSISKVGKVAGCMVTEGEVKRGAKVRLLRDDTVIYEGALKQLKRFKDDVREVKNGYECGMAFENYDDIKEGDVVECFEIQSIQRAL